MCATERGGFEESYECSNDVKMPWFGDAGLCERKDCPDHLERWENVWRAGMIVSAHCRIRLRPQPYSLGFVNRAIKGICPITSVSQ
jgi:hypothetical protein